MSWVAAFNEGLLIGSMPNKEQVASYHSSAMTLLH